MTIADLSEIEAEIDVDETDVVGIKIGQPATVSIDAFPEKKFKAEVVKVGNSAVTASNAINPSDQTTNFRVTLALREAVPGIKPALSCSADIVTAVRERTLTVPIQALTIRTLPAKASEAAPTAAARGGKGDGGGIRAASDPPRPPGGKEAAPGEEESDESRKEREKEGVFLIRDGAAHFAPVKTGISGERFFEVVDGLKEGDEVVTGTYQAIRDLKDGDAVKVDNTSKKPEADSSKKN